MKSIKSYIANFLFAVYILGVSHTFIEHSQFDVNCENEQEYCCMDKEHTQFDFEKHADLDFYDFIACLLGHITHSEIVDNKVAKTEEIQLQIPRDIKLIITYCLLWELPTNYNETKLPPIKVDLERKSLYSLVPFSKRGPPHFA